MTRLFLYLIGRSARNAAVRQLKRLRNPRYALAAIVGAVYFFFVFGGFRIGEAPPPEVGRGMADTARGVAPLLVGLLAAWWWLWGGYKTGLALLPAERDLLVPAPITRRQLLQYKIMQTQPQIVISALFTSFFTRGLPLTWPLRFLSGWVLFATLHQHQIAASLVHAAAEEQGRQGVRRHIIPLAFFVAAFTALAASVIRAVMDIRDTGQVTERLRVLMDEPAVLFALAPFRAVLAPTLASNAVEWMQPFAIAVLVLVGHYLWLQRTDAAFEEAAAELGAKHADRLSALRKGGVSGMRFTKIDRAKKLATPWFRMDPAGFPAFAVFWKNVVYGQRAVHPLRLVMVVFVLVAGVGAIMTFSGDEDGPALVMGSVCVGLAAVYTIAGPLAMRHDLRTDLRNMDLLRTYPITGRDLVAAEIAGTVFLVTLPQLLLGAVGIVLLGISDALLGWQAGLIVVATVIVLPVVNTVMVTVQNAIALLFPAWTPSRDAQPGGMESMGQGVITIIGTLIVFAVSLIPPLLVGSAVAGPLYLKFGAWSAVPGSLVVVAALAGQTWLFIMWLGRLYDTTDPVEAGLLT